MQIGEVELLGEVAQVVPEPSTVVLFSIGLIVLISTARRRKQ
jgi:hypothetical protein